MIIDNVPAEPGLYWVKRIGYSNFGIVDVSGYAPFFTVKTWNRWDNECGVSRYPASEFVFISKIEEPENTEEK